MPVNTSGGGIPSFFKKSRPYKENLSFHLLKKGGEFDRTKIF